MYLYGYCTGVYCFEHKGCPLVHFDFLLTVPQFPEGRGGCNSIRVHNLVWELRANELNQAIIFLMNLKNQTGKKNLRLAYSQGNNTAYPINTKAMARYLSTQHSNNKLANQRGGKKGDKKKGDASKSEDKECTC